jgi:hypothetical protein
MRRKRKRKDKKEGRGRREGREGGCMAVRVGPSKVGHPAKMSLWYKNYVKLPYNGHFLRSVPAQETTQGRTQKELLDFEEKNNPVR